MEKERWKKGYDRKVERRGEREGIIELEENGRER